MEPIRIAIVGVGCVASSLIQGLHYYKHTSKEESVPGLMNVMLGGYKLSDVKPVVAFDVNEKKVGKDLSEAIYTKPNCNLKVIDVPKTGVIVHKGPLMDGVGTNMRKYVSIDEKQKVADIEKILKENKVDVLVNLLPTGSMEATKFYINAAISVGCAVVNGMPTPVANNTDIVKMAENKKIPIIGDDVKAQVGATILHRALVDIFTKRGALLDKTIQLDWGGDMDFCNLVADGRYEKGKRQSKTEAVLAHLPNKESVKHQISAVDFIPFLNNTKEAYTRLEGRIFCDVPVRIDVFMSVQDGYNSAGILVDAIRCAKIGLDRKIGGILYGPSAYFMKRPPKQYPDAVAKQMVEEFIKKQGES